MKRLEPEKAPDPTYRQIWRVVDGAVRSALAAHPEYLASGARPRTVRNSIVKRVVGALHGYAEESAWVRSGFSPADDRAGALSQVPAGRACQAPSDAVAGLTIAEPGGLDGLPATTSG